MSEPQRSQILDELTAYYQNKPTQSKSKLSQAEKTECINMLAYIALAKTDTTAAKQEVAKVIAQEQQLLTAGAAAKAALIRAHFVNVLTVLQQKRSESTLKTIEKELEWLVKHKPAQFGGRTKNDMLDWVYLSTYELLGQLYRARGDYMMATAYFDSCLVLLNDTGLYRFKNDYIEKAYKLFKLSDYYISWGLPQCGLRPPDASLAVSP
ncbi:MAG: hypothetical protein HC842_00500 [Cytophagales bacterium]|nr:hypothetical protein [Cytophagales bacterium]